MQAIARVNLVSSEKEGGLIVDYAGISFTLKTVMNQCEMWTDHDDMIQQ